MISQLIFHRLNWISKSQLQEKLLRAYSQEYISHSSCGYSSAGTLLNFRNAGILKLLIDRWCLSWAASWFWESHLHRDQKILIHRTKNPEPVPPHNTAVHTQQIAKQEYTCSVLLWQLSPKGPTAANQTVANQSHTMCSTADTCWAQYSSIILYISARTPSSHSWFRFIFLCFSLRGTSCKS